MNIRAAKKCFEATYVLGKGRTPLSMGRWFRFKRGLHYLRPRTDTVTIFNYEIE